MNNNKSLLSKIIKYVLMFLFVFGGVFGIYSYMNKNSNEPQVRVEQKVESKENDEYIVNQAEKDYLDNKFKELKLINNDVIGYMYVPGDGGDSLKEPILQTTNNSKYLEYSIENKPAPLIGAVFMDFENKSDLNQGDVKWIFGHARAGIEEKKITLDTRVFNNMNWFAKKDYFDSHRVIVMESPERKYYYEVTGVKVVHEETDLYQIPNTFSDKNKFINMFKTGSRNWLESSKISGEDNMAVFCTCRIDNVSLRTLVLARQVPDKELKEFLEKNKELLNS
ncbi:class B sortase, LPKTxAVK-specific [Gemella parahaemolysans]